MQKTIDEQMGALGSELILMGALCEDAIAAAMKAMAEGDDAMREKTAAAERAIDEKEREIEELCMRILMRRQPVARDLRLVSAAMRMIADMERIGDQALDIAEITRFVPPGFPVSGDVYKMGRESVFMVTESIESFVKRDVELARTVMAHDDIIDDMFCGVKAALANEIAADKSGAGGCLDLLMIAKYLERICDHAVNVAEWVEYSITGSHRKQKA